MCDRTDTATTIAFVTHTLVALKPTYHVYTYSVSVALPLSFTPIASVPITLQQSYVPYRMSSADTAGTQFWAWTVNDTSYRFGLFVVFDDTYYHQSLSDFDNAEAKRRIAINGNLFEPHNCVVPSGYDRSAAFTCMGNLSSHVTTVRHTGGYNVPAPPIEAPENVELGFDTVTSYPFSGFSYASTALAALATTQGTLAAFAALWNVEQHDLDQLLVCHPTSDTASAEALLKNTVMSWPLGQGQQASVDATFLQVQATTAGP